ncbi:hypothetical protein [Sulfobacillus sp. hq2]|uniref:thioredoxin family protein n=1 Tax=Sulfobacillus TaxID=28033 RepID=UPI0011AF0190|nr:hypothetical protein [Sulfobacillus sp. hq2]MCY0908072.1 hypothetical protein [Sulfobacillus thermotolerans]
MMENTYAWIQEVALPVTLVHNARGDERFITAMSGDNMLWRAKEPPVAWDWLDPTVAYYGIGPENAEPSVWFVGEPIGQEERSWKDLVMAVGRQQRLLTPMTESIVDAIRQPVRVAVFTIPSCPKCAQAVRLIGAMALRNPKISLYAVDLDKQQGLIAKWNLQTLPAFMVNDTLSVMAANEWILAQAIQNASVEAG